MEITGLDHVVLTVRDLDTTIEFYERVLGMRAVSFAKGSRKALAFGDPKLNLHQLGGEFKPNAGRAGPGTADLSLLTDTALEQVVSELEPSLQSELAPTVLRVRPPSVGQSSLTAPSVGGRTPPLGVHEVCGWFG